MKSLWDAWLIYYSDTKEKFNKTEFDILCRLEKYFMYLLCKNTAGAIVPFALDFQKGAFHTTVLITSITNFIYGLIK